MDKNFKDDKLSSIINELKAHLFDIISKSTLQKQNTLEKINQDLDSKLKNKLEDFITNKEKILDNIIQKANDLTTEIAKLKTNDQELTDALNEITDNKKIEINDDSLIKETPKEKTKKLPTSEPKNEVEEKTLTENSKNNETKDPSIPQMKFLKESDDQPRAIIVTSTQFNNLTASKNSQEKKLLKNNEESHDTNKNITENKTNDENIEEMLEKANNLYKEGKIVESQELYDKIISINRTKQKNNHKQ